MSLNTNGEFSRPVNVTFLHKTKSLKQLKESDDFLQFKRKPPLSPITSAR